MLLFCVFVAATLHLGQGLTFLSPPEINVGDIHASIVKQLVVVADPSFFNKNVSIVIANDYVGCYPGTQDLQGKVLWSANLYSCANYGLSQNFFPQWRDTQAAGAIGVINSIVVGAGDQTSTKIFR